MSEDVKPRRFEIFYSGLANTFSVRDNFHAYIMARKQEKMDDEYIRLIELEPTLQLMKDMGEAFEEWLDDTQDDFSEQQGWKSCKEVLEKYRKFLKGVEK